MKVQEQVCVTTLLSTAQLWYEQEDTQFPQHQSGVPTHQKKATAK